MPGSSNVGIDLHDTTLSLMVRDESGNPLCRQKIPTKCVNRIRHIFADLHRPIHCAVESVGMYEWLWDLLEPIVDKMMLADASRLSFRMKGQRAVTDKTVAAFLSDLVYKDEVPMAWAPDAETRALRKIGRQWHNVSRNHTKAVIQAEWIFKQHNLNGPGKIRGESLQRWLLGQGHRLEAHALFVLIQLLQTMCHFEYQMVELRRGLIAMSRTEKFAADIERLKTVPGIADILAPIIRAEFGDIGRFRSADAMAAFTGLTERTQESNGTVKPGRISKHGSGTLRWALVEATTTLVRSDPKYKAIYNRILKNTKYKTQAKVAVARKLVCWIWTMFKNNTDFIRGGTTDHVKRANQARLAKKAKPA